MSAAVDSVRHEPTDDCDGLGVSRLTLAGGVVIARHEHRCGKCGAHLCSCELAYGHDCE
jgi:hypothetical protein